MESKDLSKVVPKKFIGKEEMERVRSKSQSNFEAI